MPPKDENGPATPDPDGEKIDVAEILRSNAAIQGENEKPLEFNEKKSRKRRDYIVCMVVVNPLIVIPYFLLEKNMITGIFTLAALITFSVGFSWVMWFIASDY